MTTQNNDARNANVDIRAQENTIRFLLRIACVAILEPLRGEMQSKGADERLLFALRILQMLILTSPILKKGAEKAYSSVYSLCKKETVTPVPENDPDAHLPANIRERIETIRCFKFFFLTVGIMSATALLFITPKDNILDNNQDTPRPDPR